jgi:hypothetical protein
MIFWSFNNKSWFWAWISFSLHFNGLLEIYDSDETILVLVLVNEGKFFIAEWKFDLGNFLQVWDLYEWNQISGSAVINLNTGNSCCG